MTLRFYQMMSDPALGVTDDQWKRWINRRYIPTQILQQYYDEGLPFVQEAPITTMRLKTFENKIEELLSHNEDIHVRKLAEYVRLEIATAVSGFDQIGKPDPRCKTKTRCIAKNVFEDMQNKKESKVKKTND